MKKAYIPSQEDLRLLGEYFLTVPTEQMTEKLKIYQKLKAEGKTIPECLKILKDK